MSLIEQSGIMELDFDQIEMVDGGISTRSIVIIAGATMVCPLLGMGMALGYAANM